MGNIPTPHINAKLEDIAKTVIMPGDPLRAKFIAETYLEDVTCFNNVRNILGFTGMYKKKRVSVMASGMGMPSMGIYSYELFNFYNVDNIIRVGSAGSICDNVNLKDIIIAMAACTDSNYTHQYSLQGMYAPIASYKLLEKSVNLAKEKNLNFHVGNILSSDVFYTDTEKFLKPWASMGVLAAEMESVALYANAAKAKKNALCILTVSDHIFKGDKLSAEDRQTSFREMMELALETAISIDK